MAKPPYTNEEVDEDGLTPMERQYLSTPMSQMTPEERIDAIRIREKRDSNVWGAKETQRRAEEQERKFKLDETKSKTNKKVA